MESEKHNIKIEVITSYIEEQSLPNQDHYVFSYTITIRNDGDAPAKLMTRHWIIKDANGKTNEVRGEGVVGEQPYLKPGESYQYTSGTMIETPVGSMEGSYQMVDDNGEKFDAPVAPFTLAIPRTLH